MHGADIHATDSHGETAFHYACFNYNSLQVMKLLINAGANVNAITISGQSPLILMFAVLNNDITLDQVKLLLSVKDIDVNFCDKSGYNALTCAIFNNVN